MLLIVSVGSIYAADDLMESDEYSDIYDDFESDDGLYEDFDDDFESDILENEVEDNKNLIENENNNTKFNIFVMTNFYIIN